MRFPPFDEPAHEASELPIADVCWQEDSGCSELSIGSDTSWFIKREAVPSPPKSSLVIASPSHDAGGSERRSTRAGWALSPHPLHHIARTLIPYAVAFLIIGIFLHVMEPALLNWGIMSESMAGSVKLGMLDYPVLFVTAAPLVLVPIVMRVMANVADVRRQRQFARNPPPAPVLSIVEAVADRPVRFRCEFPGSLKVTEAKAWVRVGLLSPQRDAWMAAHGFGSDQRPPPGLSTPLPEGWMPKGDDGSGVGESTPLVVGRGPARLFQEPMRLRAEGASATVVEDANEAEVPAGPWPGSEYGPLVNIHWELVLHLKLDTGRPLYWLEPLDMISAESGHNVPETIAHSGRLETYKTPDGRHES